MSAFANILAGGVFHAAVLFLVAAGLAARLRRAEDRQSRLRLVLRARRVFRHHLHRLCDRSTACRRG